MVIQSGGGSSDSGEEFARAVNRGNGEDLSKWSVDARSLVVLLSRSLLKELRGVSCC